MGHLHIVFLPLMAHGHMIPTLDMAKLFTSRGLKTTIIATPSFAHSINKARESGHDIGLSIIDFPPEKSSLPKNILSLDQVSTPDMLSQFFQAVSLLQEPVEKLLHELNPNCLVSDGFMPWTLNFAAKLGIPRLVFLGISCFALCAVEQMEIHKPYKNVSSDSEPFVLPNLPHKLTFVRSQMAPHQLNEDEDDFSKLRQQMRESDERSYGVLINSFHELESDYADHYKNIMGIKAWHIGPLFLCNKRKESSIDEHECLAWLDSKRPDSVVYVCFGSMVTFTPAQMHETAVGLEASGQDFIWVVRRGKHDEEFEERTKGKGLIIRGWAPQVMILDHPSIGAFVTHCGWNSTLEGICAGVPMVTWPTFAEQFYNEKMVTEVLGTGVSVGNKKYWANVASQEVPREAVEKAVRRIMVGEVAEEMRSRARCYKEMARKAVKEGGSSYQGLNALIDELSIYVPPKKHDIN
ncbi:scopoletin glucosyltransferase [Phtheirospermum japonicum]|uniref:Glycosyltransferase n=1 Tax=Phtheirospermum japonicum TaxID=374723 RepID=A0A830BIP9_9LAMI|nr:scopoletin glucosyltransferase [Phtheirospermum japonicum]